MSDLEGLYSFMLILLAFLIVAIPHVARAIKREAAMSNKHRADGSLDQADEAVRRWQTALRQPKCQTCKHWLPIYYGGKGPQLIDGICQRYPKHMSRRRRITLATDQCGEHVTSVVA